MIRYYFRKMEDKSFWFSIKGKVDRDLRFNNEHYSKILVCTNKRLPGILPNTIYQFKERRNNASLQFIKVLSKGPSTDQNTDRGSTLFSHEIWFQYLNPLELCEAIANETPK